MLFSSPTCQTSADEGAKFIIAGKYEDELIQVNKEWKIASRVLTKIWTEGNEKVVNP